MTITRSRILRSFGPALFASAAGLNCTDDTPAEAVASLGAVTVEKYAAVGDGLTSGFQSNALYASAQTYSYPSLIARQLRAAGAQIGTFEQPTIADPGNPDPATGFSARVELISILGPVISSRGLTPGSPTNAGLGRPFDNLGLPDAPLSSFLDSTGTYHGGLGSVIIRPGGGFSESPYGQLRMLNPDLVTFWLGFEDVVGYAISGGVTPPAPTPASTFAALYDQSLDSLRNALPEARILLATIPDVSILPYLTTIGPKIRSNPGLASYFEGGGTFYYQKRNEPGAGTGSSKLNGSPDDPLVTLLGSVYSFSLGITTYAPFRALGGPYSDYANAQSMGIDSTKPFGLDPQNPFPALYVLDIDEQAVIRSTVEGYNAAVHSSAAEHDAVVWDSHAFFENVRASGQIVAGYTFTADFVVGGIFSLDGIHLSSRGYAIIANEMIKTLNREFGMNIGLIDVMSIPGIPAPPLTKSGSTDLPRFSYD